jgi:hypothetical protein
MKKLLTIAALLGAASLSFGQGTVNFSAGATAATRISTNQVVGGPATGQINGAGSYYFALFAAPTSNNSSGSGLNPTGLGWSLVGGTYGTNTAALGRFNGNPSTDGTVVAGFPTGSSANFLVVGWSANVAGPDWNAFVNWYNNGEPASTGWAGKSLIAQNVQLGGGLTPQGNIFGANPGQVPGFLLGRIDAVPEPSTMALAGLGAAALMIFRRRK